MNPEACPLCTPGDEITLWRDDSCRIVWVEDPDDPGYCRVILNAHVREMTDLPEDQRYSLMAVVFAVEAAMREVLRPDKVNLASLGNQVPHLHWHEQLSPGRPKTVARPLGGRPRSGRGR